MGHPTSAGRAREKTSGSGGPPPGLAGLDFPQGYRHRRRSLPAPLSESMGLRRRHGWQLLHGAAATPRRRSHLTGSDCSPSLHVSHPWTVQHVCFPVADFGLIPRHLYSYGGPVS